MDLKNLLAYRFSVRAYTDSPVEEEKLIEVLDAVRLAPSAANRQPFQFIVINTRGREKELLTIYNRDWFVQAPIAICAVGLPHKGWTRFDGANYTHVDVTIAMDHLVLSATNLGLGTCWIAAFNPEAAREVLNLPQDVEPILFTPLGYPAEQPKEKIRKPLDELIRYERW